MIVEGFLLLVLFQAHNLGNIKRRGQMGRVLERRCRVGSLIGCTDSAGAIEADFSRWVGTLESMGSSETDIIELKS